ncbi:MAG TPA: hypothetical protein VJ725_07965 [Thermoanaerobaculia bacterium]|nr:hypothetical protein [Thermoanaerobaculia bacterium]
MNAARRTLGSWLLMAFLERGCEPKRRIPRQVVSIRPLSPEEMAALNPLAASLVPLTNLRFLPLPRLSRREVYEV